MSWAKSRMVAFDLETTAPDPDEARIVTVAHVDIRPANAHGAPAPAVEVERWSELVNPGIDIPAEATAIHGVTTEKARAEGVGPALAVVEIVGRLYDGWNAGAPVVGHNVVYDLTVLDRELRRVGGPESRGLVIRGPVIDTLCLDHAIDRYRKGKRNLTAACEHYDVRLDGAHDATEDALASARIAWRMCQRYPSLAAMSLDDLQTYQAEQYEMWAEGFEAYLRKAKKRDGEPQAAIDAVRIDRDWPLKPYQERRAA